MSNPNLHPIFEAILAPFAPRELTLSDELLDAIDGYEETRGRDSRLQAWAVAARKLEVAQGERDAMAATLKDIAMGMQLSLDSGVWSGAARDLIKEVLRVAKGGLKEGSVS
jgi:hypothetical protein